MNGENSKLKMKIAQIDTLIRLYAEELEYNPYYKSKQIEAISERKPQSKLLLKIEQNSLVVCKSGGKGNISNNH